MTRYRVGCTGWGYDDWRGGFYPPHAQPADYLERYARVFDLTEVDSSFYQAPGAQQTARWAFVTPPGFTFSLKFPRTITHEARLRDVRDKTDAFLVALAPLRRAGKLGPLVLQFPASFSRDEGARALGDFLSWFPRDLPLCVELRHPSWWVPETYRALAAAGATLVWSTTEAGRTPAVLTSDHVYARLIGDRALTRYDRVQRDATLEMRYWRERFEDEGRSAGDAMVLVNNQLMGFAPAAASQMMAMLGLPLPDLTRAQRDTGQQALF